MILFKQKLASFWSSSEQFAFSKCSMFNSNNSLGLEGNLSNYTLELLEMHLNYIHHKWLR